MRYDCCDERRLRAVKEAGALNGIEYLEVSDSDAPPGLRQRTLFVRLLQAPVGMDRGNVLIEGGERIPVAVTWAAPATAPPTGEPSDLTDGLDQPETVLLVRTDSTGDFSTYRLRLVAGPGSDEPPAGFDPQLTSVDFSFKVECEADFDCEQACNCQPAAPATPTIDYLAKDFASFRSLMLDRLSLLAPGWRERSSADVGIALVELLAYVGDELSYRQDAVATEAYLGTARRRTSLRRHSRLVDYTVHEGVNARAWIRVFVTGEGVVLEPGTPLLTRVPGVAEIVEPDGSEHRTALAAGAETFETLDREVLFASNECFDFWTWGDAGCCLPRGATSATLAGEHPQLKAGDVLILAEVTGPRTGRAEDADPQKRVAVRLTSVVSSSDPSGGVFAGSTGAVAVTEIEWDEQDALPFPLCISVAERPGVVFAEAWGNIVLADHGRTIADEPLGTVPEPILTRVAAGGCDRCAPREPASIPVRFRPALSRSPITHQAEAPIRLVADGPVAAGSTLESDLATMSFEADVRSFLEDRGISIRFGQAVMRGGHDRWSVSDGETVALLRLLDGTLSVFGRPASASSVTASRPRGARPAIELSEILPTGPEPWRPQLDLLASDDDAPEFVVEVEHDGSAALRFGDGRHGRRPDPRTEFRATYRVGNGAAGNVGAGAIAHAVLGAGGGVVRVTNPLPARGGEDPEPAEAVRRDAPEAYRVQERAVTAADYESVTERSPSVQRAAATIRWTGSWHTVFVTADTVGGRALDERLERDLRRDLDRYRMAGVDLEVDAPRFVALDVALHLCVEADYFRSDVRAAVLDVLSSGARRDGLPGLFHPDRFTFGQPVYLSAVVAAAQSVAGVRSVEAERFQRQHDAASAALDTGVLPLGRLEIAQLANDPTFPERGVLVVTAEGGK